MKLERRPEASDILDLVRTALSAGVGEDKVTGFVNDVLNAMIRSAAIEEREGCLQVLRDLVPVTQENRVPSVSWRI